MSLDLSYLGITATKEIYRNLPVAILTEKALARGEGTLSNTGALVVKTGKYTGRSANDKFIVDTPAVHDEIAWGKVNRPIDKATYDAIYSKVVAYLQNREIFVFDGFAGADKKYMQAFPHHQRAGQPEPVHSPAAAPPHRGRPGGLQARLHHYCGSRLQVHPRNRQAPAARLPSWSTTKRRWLSSAAPSTRAKLRSPSSPS